MADKRLFIALWPDERQRNMLRDVFRPLLSTVEGNAVDRRNWHVTLVFVGSLADEKVPALIKTVSQIEVQPFRLRFDRLDFWPRPKIACLQAMVVPEELKKLKSDLGSALLPFDIEPESLEYRPHITAVRPARPFETQRLARPVELLWSNIELVESISGAGGIQYHPLKQ